MEINRNSNKLNTMFLTGLKELGTLLLGKFKWGPGFFSLNQEVLDQYAKCSNGEEVIKAQQQYLDMVQQESIEARLQGMYFTVKIKQCWPL